MVAVCRAVPNEYRNIAIAVSQVAPGAGKEIVNAVAAALPDPKPYIEKALAGYGGNVVSVADTLDQAARSVPKAATPSATGPSGLPQQPLTPTTVVGRTPVARAPLAARGPSVGPPYIPLTSTPTNVTLGTSGTVPTGGRNYADP